MENLKTSTNQNLFHTQVLKNTLSQDPIPSGHQRILEDWAKNIALLNQQDKAAQHAAFVQKILVDLLGYQAASDNSGYSLKDMTAPDSYFDAALGQFEKENDRIATLLKLMGPTSTSLAAPSENEQPSPIELARQHVQEMPDRPFFLLSNLDEIRLYSLAHKRNAFERFSLIKMAENAAEYQRFYLLLNPKNMLSGKTMQWLHESVAIGLQDKLTQKHQTLKDAYSPLQSGVPLDMNDAFVIDKQTYDQLIKEDPKSSEILKAFYPGDSLRRWYADSRLHWLIYTPKGQVDIDAYPTIKKHLEPFKSQLEKREGDQKWYELDHTENTNIPVVTKLRLGTGRLQAEPGFVLGEGDAQYGKDSFYIPNADYFLLALLNSTALAKLITTLSHQTDDGMYTMQADLIEALPIPDANGLVRARLGELGQFCMVTAQDRRDTIRHFPNMAAFNLSPDKLAAKISDKLLSWFAHDFSTFRNEVITSFGVDIPAGDLQVWSGYFNQEKEAVSYMDSKLEQTESEINLIVYQLFGLDEDDIALIELG
ncbi:MAG: type II restriction endonuclease [Betaproteobacteria bacterium]|nr:type II restriction endonuclease [Betaproteobacteria bacterium]